MVQNAQHRYSTRFAAMLQDKLYAFLSAVLPCMFTVIIVMTRKLYEKNFLK